jgi:hypothetical protein
MEAGLKVKMGQEGPSLLTHRVGRGQPARLLLLSMSETTVSVSDRDSMSPQDTGDTATAIP